MIITRLRLKDFKRHRALDIELGPGLNVIRGPNEAGKSTVQRAIEMVLFRRPTFASAELEEVRPWGDSGAEPVIEMAFDEGDRHGTLRKHFAGPKGTVELRLGDETQTDPAAVDQTLVPLLGLPTEKFFRATASIHHHDLAGLNQDESTLRDRLQQSMSGADRGTHAARRKLEEAIRRYRTEGAKNPGYLKVLRTEVERLSALVKQGEAALGQLEADRRAMAEARAKLSQLEAKLAEQREGTALAERATVLTTNAAEAARRYTMYKRAVELREEIDRLEAAHPTSIPIATLRSTVDQLRSLEFNLSEMRAELAAEPDLSGYHVAIPRPRWRPWMIVGAVLVLAGLGIAVLGIAAGQAVAGLVLGVGLVLVALVAFGIGVRGLRHLGDIALQTQLRDSDIARRLGGRTDLAERVRQTEQERAEVLASLRMTDVPAAEATLAAETEHISEIASRRAEYKGLTGDDNPKADIAELRDQAAAEADQCRHALAGLGDIGRDPERYVAAFNLAVQRLTQDRETALQAVAHAEARVAANETDAEEVAANAEALAASQESLAASERRVRIYEELLSTLNAAERATMKKAARFLEKRMAADIERLTDGRYRRLNIDEATLTFSVYSPELDDWIDVRRLSQGTLDQIYLCARLGIVRQVTDPADPPLVFDDPFVTFDADRAKRALALLKDMSKEFQVIYLTTSDRYDEIADRVIELPEPPERSEPEPEQQTGPAGEPLSMWPEGAPPATSPRTPAASGGAPRAAKAAPEQLWPEER